jgi:hypothetical protein
MTATARHLALLRQPWQVRRLGTGWQRTWVGPLVCTLGALALVLMWPALSRLWLASLGLVWLAWLWWLLAEGLHRQNLPALARLLPGQVNALRLQLLVHAALVTAVAVAAFTLALGPVRPWLWLVLPVVVMMAWLAREPWLWLLPVIFGPWVPLHAWAADASGAAPGLKLLALLAAALLLVASVGNGGSLHRWHAASCTRWRRAEAAQREGRGVPSTALSLPLRALLRLFDWPRLVWRRQVLARGTAAPLGARLSLGLGFGGQWAELLWSALLLFITPAFIVSSRWRNSADIDLQEMVDFSRFGVCIGVFSMIVSTQHGRLSRLWTRRREQALLALLPGVPSRDFSAVEGRWRREYLLSWLVATAAVLALGAAGSPGSLDYTAFCAAFCLPLAWLAQHQQRRLQGRPALAPLALAPVLAAVIAWPVQQLGLPAWASLATGVLVYAALARRHDPRHLELPLGRTVTGPETMTGNPALDPR